MYNSNKLELELNRLLHSVAVTSYENITKVETTNIPLTDIQLRVVIVVHFLTFLFGGATIWVLYKKLPVIQTRIWSPYVLLTGLIWLQLGAAFEIADHQQSDWELVGSPSSFINGVFYFFNFGGNYLNVLGLRKKGLAFFRFPSDFSRVKIFDSLFDIVAVIFDIFMVIAIILSPILYATMGRANTTPITSAFGAIAGIGTLFRLWKNLGPNKLTLCGGVGFFCFAILGVIMLSVYNATGIEFVHTFIGGSFVFSLVPISIALWNTDEMLSERDVASNEDV